MKVAEVLNGIVTSFPPFWKDVSEIPEGTIDIYFNAPDEVEEGWLFDGVEYTKPPEPEISIEDPPMTVEQAMSIIVMQMSGMEVSPEQKAKALSTIAKAAGMPIT